MSSGSFIQKPRPLGRPWGSTGLGWEWLSGAYVRCPRAWGSRLASPPSNMIWSYASALVLCHHLTGASLFWCPCVPKFFPFITIFKCDHVLKDVQWYMIIWCIFLDVWFCSRITEASFPFRASVTYWGSTDPLVRRFSARQDSQLELPDHSPRRLGNALNQLCCFGLCTGGGRQRIVLMEDFWGFSEGLFC